MNMKLDRDFSRSSTTLVVPSLEVSNSQDKCEPFALSTVFNTNHHFLLQFTGLGMEAHVREEELRHSKREAKFLEGEEQVEDGTQSTRMIKAQKSTTLN